MKIKDILHKCKFGIGDLQGVIITFVIIGIVAIVGLTVMVDQKDDLTEGTVEYNASTAAIEGISEFPSKLPMLAGIIVGVMVIGIVVTYFAMKRND